MTVVADDEHTRIARTQPPAPPAPDDRTRLTLDRGGSAPPAAPPQGEGAPRADFQVTRWTSQSVVQIGEVLINTYRIDAFVARGGMGAVYRATHVLLNTQHAIKIIVSDLADNPDVLEALKREADALRRVRNDAVVQYEGLLVDNRGWRFLVMEFVEGPSLGEVIKERQLAPDEVRTLKNRLALGLAAAHEVGIVHRDIAPDNVILREGKIEGATLIDFGIAKNVEKNPAAAERSIFAGDFVGKYAFASPEHFSDSVEKRSDIYSLGLLLAAAAIGHGGRLKMGANYAEMVLARQKVPDLDVIPAELQAEIGAMLQPAPDDRPQAIDAVDPDARPDVTVRTQLVEVRPAFLNPAVLRPVLVGVGVVIALGVAHVVYPRPLLALFGTNTNLVATDISQRLDSLRCATIDVAVSQDYLFRVKATLSGTVATDSDSAAAGDLAHLRNVSSVSNALQVVPWPFCDIVNIAHTVDGSTSARALPAIQPDQPQELLLHDGDRLVLGIIASPLFDGYLYVDYVDQDGNVAHMIPNPRRADNKVTAGQQLTLGAAKGERNPTDQAYEITGPFGQQMILAVSSPSPLFQQPRPQFETAAAYLAALRDAVTKVSTSPAQAAVASYRFLTTEAAAATPSTPAPASPARP